MAIAIITQPVDVTFPIGGTATFIVEATGEGLSYQWQWQRASGGDWGNSGLATANAATLEVPATADRNGQHYRCVITDASGDTVASDAATLTVREAVVTIIKQPVNITAIVGTTAKFAVLAEGDISGYRWNIFKPGISEDWAVTSMTGNKTPVLEIPADVSRNGYMYRCVITDSSGNQYITDEVTLTVIDGGFINRSTLTAIADAIRAKTNGSGTILPSEMAALIAGITTGLPDGVTQLEVAICAPTDRTTLAVPCGMSAKPKGVAVYQKTRSTSTYTIGYGAWWEEYFIFTYGSGMSVTSVYNKCTFSSGVFTLNADMTVNPRFQNSDYVCIMWR